jgi:glycolate oxidase FAD binding subunit
MTDPIEPTQDFCIDGFGPLPIVAPRTVSEVGNELRRAVATDEAVYPVGGGTMLEYGLPPARPGRVIDLRPLNQVIDYPARDMTITVQSGIRIEELQELLAMEKQRLPVDVPFDYRATLGGAIATNMSGPRRYGFGTLRDYVIGISAVNDHGEEIKAGGRVVKNVAGYDLCKLFIGSLGTLGIITHVTLKLKPKPETSALLSFACPPETIANALDRLNGSRTRPACISLLNAPAAGPFPGLDKNRNWLLVVGFEDNDDAVRSQIAQLKNEITGCENEAHGPWTKGDADLWWRTYTDMALSPPASVTFKASLLPSHAAAFCLQAAKLCADTWMVAEAGNGIVIGHLPQDLTLEHAQSILTTLLDLAVAADGNLVLLRCPTAWKPGLPVWGRPRGDFTLMRAVKDMLDPRRIFNPGRFVDGL